MTEAAVKQYLEYLNKESETKKELFQEAKKGSLQFSLNKIPNFENDKRVICKLPNAINKADQELQICLIVKDIDPKNRDYDNTLRKYKQMVEDEKLTDVITQIIPIKQLKLEFRHFEAKRKLCTSFDMFLSDKCLHEILFSGSKLGKEFKKRKRMPVEIDMDKPIKAQIDNILHSTTITLTGKGPILDVNTFLSTHTVKEACENISAVRKELVKHLPGGESNIKSIYIKSTDQIAVPIYQTDVQAVKKVKVENNMTPAKVNKAKKLSGKRLKRKKLQEARKKKREERALLVETNKAKDTKQVKEEKPTAKKETTTEKPIPKVVSKAIKKPAGKDVVKKTTLKKTVKLIK